MEAPKRIIEGALMESLQCHTNEGTIIRYAVPPERVSEVLEWLKSLPVIDNSTIRNLSEERREKAAQEAAEEERKKASKKAKKEAKNGL